jgi:serine/threonine-protein kinase
VFEAESLTDLLVKIATAPVPSLRARRAEVPPEVEALLARCLARDPAARYAGMAELLSDVRALLGGEPRVPPLGATTLGTAATVNAKSEGVRAAFDAAREDARTSTKAARAAAVLVAFVGAALFARSGGIGGERSSSGKQYPRESNEARVAPVARPSLLDEAPPTGNDAARLAYAEGVQAYRDAARFRFIAAMEKALAADPALAIAHLFVALERNPYDGEGARDHLRLARTYRATLSPSGEALLDAAEAYVQPTWDLAGFERRLVHASEAFPRDSLLVEWRGVSRQFQGFHDLAQADQGEAAKLDPRRSTPLWRQGQVLLLAGRTEEALGVWNRCLEANPHAIGCRDNRARLAFAPAGRCADVEGDLRALVAEEPSVPRYPEALAGTLAARGEPVEVVVEVLAKRLPLLPEATRRAASLDDRAALALLDGDLASAVRFARERVALAHGPIDEQVAAVQRLADLLVEIGDGPAAATVAAAFLERKDALPGAHTPLDRSASLLVYVRDARRMTEEAFRAAWEADAPYWDAPSTMRARADGGRLRSMDLWTGSFAAAARDDHEAAEALATEAGFVAVHPQASVSDLYARGRVKALAGRLEEARVDLERAAGHCEALGSVDRVRARMRLGDVFARAGKREAACEAYGAVNAVWGHAKPRAVTADEARAASSKLACPARP